MNFRIKVLKNIKIESQSSHPSSQNINDIDLICLKVTIF